MSSTVMDRSSRTGERILRKRFPRIWLTALGLILSDVLAITVGYFLFRHGRPMPAILLPAVTGTPNVESATDIYLLMGALFVVVRGVLGDYTRRQLFWDGARSTSSTLPVLAIPDVLLVLLVGGRQLYPWLILSWLFLILAIPIFRQLARYVMSAIGIWQIPTALIGTGRKSCEVNDGLRGTLSLGFSVRFLVPGNDRAEIPAKLKQLKRVNAGDSKTIAENLIRLGCAQVIVSAEDAQDDLTSSLIQRLIATDIGIAIIPSLHGFPLFGLRTNYLFGRDMLLLQLRNNLARIPGRAVKRVIDVVGPLFVLLLTAPLWIFIMLAIKLHDGGPIFYVQKRVGRNGKLFPCLKFRTMAVDADERLARWRDENPALYSEFQETFKLRDDPRITGPGRWLRRTSLDELPQALNILAGHMSTVGPRPVLEKELSDYYGSAADLYKLVRPGLTGLWQISGRSDTSYADRVGYDEWYILNWSLWYDAVIMLYTFWIVCSGKGAF